MTFNLSEIGRTGQKIDVLHGGDVGPDGKLLTYHELRNALRIAHQIRGTANYSASQPAPNTISPRMAAGFLEPAVEESFPGDDGPGESTPSSPPAAAGTAQIQLVWDRIHQLMIQAPQPWDTDTVRQMELDRNWLATQGIAVPRLSGKAGLTFDPLPPLGKTSSATPSQSCSTKTGNRAAAVAQQHLGRPVDEPTQDCPICAADA